MADIIKLIKKQSQQRISELRELSGRLSEQLKHLINLIPENTRQKSVEDFLDGIRTNVLVEPGRKPAKRAKRAGKAPAPKRAAKTKTRKPAAKRGMKKKMAPAPAELEQKPG